MNRIISKNSARKILKSKGAKVISKGAVEKLSYLLEEFGKEVSRKAIRNALFAGRKRIKSEDIEGKA